MFRLSSKHASDKLSFSSYSKVNAFFQIAIFRFFAQRNLYTALLTMLVKQYTVKRKMISKNIIADTFTKIWRNFNSFNFQQFSIFMNDNIEYLSIEFLSAKNKFPSNE